MHKNTLLAAVISISFAVPALASDGNITFSGLVRDSTCELNINNEGVVSTLIMPDVPVSELSTVGATAGETPFTVSLENCASTILSSAYVYFHNPANSDETTGRLWGTLNVQDNKLQIELLTSDRVPIFVGDEARQQANANNHFDFTSGSAQRTYIARYYASGPVLPEPAFSIVGLDIIYM
ncbi:fimbrial protein [Entomohabitans teleogrylli]|uniref:fimbrial protein n=1 Tax=Entomohabitans teleogrylli TaxID=1384589 RepID=UPI00073D6B3D|nr:fimbrial protein [Entomohabitans teleogrylli]